MGRFLLRRLAVIPVALVSVNFVGFTYAHVAIRFQEAQNPWGTGLEKSPLTRSVPVDFPYRPSRFIAVDEDATTYLCGRVSSPTQSPFARTQGLECRAHRPGPGEPLWTVALERGGFPNGGALIPGRLYVTTDNGLLYAIGDGQPAH